MEVFIKKMLFAMLITLVLMACPSPNQIPVINSITAEKNICFSGEEIQITVDAVDPDGEPLSYQWLCKAGEIITTIDNTCIWRAPAKTGTFDIELSVDDGAFSAKSTATITVNDLLANVNLHIQANTGGSTLPAGDLSQTYGQSLTIQAVPDTGYAFTGWEVNNANAVIADKNAAMTTTILKKGIAEITANFTNTHYNLTVLSDANGTVTSESNPTAFHGVALTISAVPAGAGYTFKEWSISSGTGVVFADAQAATTTITLTAGDAAVQAVFQLKTFLLTTASDISATLTPLVPASVNYDTPIAITAVPADSCLQFTRWEITSGTGALIENSAAAATTIRLTEGDVTVKAVFAVKLLHLL